MVWKYLSFSRHQKRRVRPIFSCLLKQQQVRLHEVQETDYRPLQPPQFNLCCFTITFSPKKMVGLSSQSEILLPEMKSIPLRKIESRFRPNMITGSSKCVITQEANRKLSCNPLVCSVHSWTVALAFIFSLLTSQCKCLCL